MEKLKFEDIEHGQVLQSSKDYAIEFSNQEILNKASNKYPSIFKEVSNNVGILNFRNFVGECDFLGKLVKVNSKKISQNNYKIMMADLVDKMAQLPFDFNTPTLTDFQDQGLENPSILYHLFLVVRHFVIEIEDNVSACLENIISNPAEKIEPVYKEVPIWEVKHLSKRTFNSMIHSNDWIQINDKHNVRKAALATKVYYKDSYSIPGVAEDYHVTRSFDNSENRFIKYFLKLCLDVTQRFNFIITNENRNLLNRLELVEQCTYMEEILEEWIYHEFFSLIGEMVELPYNSMILQRREGYKGIYDFYNRLLCSLEFPLSDEKLERLIENKDVAQLYEIWTFIATINTLEHKFSMKPKKSLIIKADEYRASIGSGIYLSYEYKGVEVKLWYNKTFYKGEGSYSLTLRPDIVLEVGDNVYIFDAKFKLESLTWNQSNEDDIEEKNSFTFKNGDIYKMHTYKDAIKGAVFSCILYPNPNESTPLFFSDGLGNRGVGAVPLLPSNYLTVLGEFLGERCFNIGE
ncbi:DUF2357 domain-containing protein [Priestia aryabhattai]|uniref:DUF2357 domain-containing protein n=1 Tax=Priestia aryabhattai TaxID=412384 RepID=UPI002E221504|nr:DUF2357 domain-containing protein [Priestia aryabhattai]